VFTTRTERSDTMLRTLAILITLISLTLSASAQTASKHSR
jgi:hypothetical protein